MAGETGHLVLSTLHTTNATETVNRIVDFFPPFQQQQIRLTLAGVLQGVVSQRLVPRSTGTAEWSAVEAMVMTGRISDRIMDPTGGSGETIEEVIADGEYHGMATFDQSLFALFKGGEVTLRAALQAATNPHDFRVALQTAGLLPLRSKRPARVHRARPLSRLTAVVPERLRPMLSTRRTSWPSCSRPPEHHLYLVGGVVRDAVLGRLSDDADLDFTTDALPSATEDILGRWADAVPGPRANDSAPSVPEGRRSEIEVTTHRAEAYDPTAASPRWSSPRHRGGPVPAGLHRQRHGPVPARPAAGRPLRRRRRPGRHEAARPRWPPRISFSDDPLRMMRAARFIAGYGLAPDPELVEAVTLLRARLDIVSDERVRDELDKLMVVTTPAKACGSWSGRGWPRSSCPSCRPGPRAGPGPPPQGRPGPHHRGSTAGSPERIVRLAALFHDVGKPKTRSFGPAAQLPSTTTRSSGPASPGTGCGPCATRPTTSTR